MLNSITIITSHLLKGPKDCELSLPQYKVSIFIHSSGNRFFMFGIVDWMMPTIKKVTTVIGYAGMTPIHLPRCPKYS